MVSQHFLEVALLLLWVEALYHLVISSFGLGRGRATVHHPPRNRFAILIPAHNEELIVESNIRSLFAMCYPRSLYDIFVIADHCEDRTAERAAKAGATVLVRGSGRADGKPGALNWACASLAGQLDEYDAIVVLDADNLVSPNFLSVMNSRLEMGERLIQGHLDVKNPAGSWVAGSIALAYWSTSRIHQLARHNLGLCAALGGTGICIERKLLLKHGWNTNCLTEDLDFQIRALRGGVRTTWAHDSRVYDEKPTSLRVSMRQRLRWMRGHISVAMKHIPALVAQGFSQGNLACLDAALYLAQPFRLAFACLCLIAWQAWTLFGDPHFFLPSSVVTGLGILYFLQLSQFLFGGLGLLALVRERVPIRYWRYYFHSLAFGLTWLPVIFVALVRPKGSWTHTRHEARVEIQERLALRIGSEPQGVARQHIPEPILRVGTPSSPALYEPELFMVGDEGARGGKSSQTLDKEQVEEVV